jgi:stage III sporulation protein AC
MAVDFILKLAGVGMIVSITCQVLSKAGREEQATLVSIGGIVLALLLLVERIGELFDAVFRVFGL